jgi:hypothetical protein
MSLSLTELFFLFALMPIIKQRILDQKKTSEEAKKGTPL